MWYAIYHSKDIQVITRYCDQLAESGINTRFFWSDLGATYSDFLHQYEKAVAAFEKVLEINPERIGDWKFVIFWDRFMMALHKTGKHEREREISYLVLKILPDQSNWPYYRMAICALSHGNTEEANEILVKYMAKHKELGTKENLLELFLGQMYEEANIMDQAEMHFRKAHIFYLAQFLINNDRNVDEGMELIHKLLEEDPKDEFALQLEGWGLYKQGKYAEAVQLLEQMSKRSEEFYFDLYTHLEAAKKAVANQKNN
jgi:tetratricopeptide (TPR) repeat protein